ncbi:caspase a [Sander vitreus]
MYNQDRNTVKEAIGKKTAGTLSQHLDKSKVGRTFLSYVTRHQLKDRREESRVRYRDVENKSVLQITDLLVSTFTERGALPVVLSIVKQINCNQEAETLYSETKGCVDLKGDPTFRKTSSGE